MSYGSQEVEQSPATHNERTAPRAVRLVAGAAASVAAVGIIALMLLAVVDIARREKTGRGFEFSIDVTEVALVAIVFAGMGSAQLSRSHVKTPVLTDRLPPVARASVRLAALTISIALVVWLAAVTAIAAQHSYAVGETRFGLSRIAIWPAKVAIPIGLAIFGLALATQLVAVAKDLHRAVRHGASR